MKIHGLTLEEYIVLLLLNKKQYDEIDDIISNEDKLQSILKGLVLKRFIVLKEYGYKDSLGDYKILYIPKPSQLEFDKWFMELINLYPKIITRPNGLQDNLHSNLNKCKELYKKATKGDKNIHKHIINCLSYQLDYIKRRSDGLGYMKKLSKWIEEEVWKDYEVMLEKNKQVNGNNANNTVAYGERIL